VERRRSACPYAEFAEAILRLIQFPTSPRHDNHGESNAGRLLAVMHTEGGTKTRLITGAVPLCTPGNVFNCVDIVWPSEQVRAYLDGAPPRDRGHWVGSLIHDQRDETGLLYRRNRYYDPTSGQFTQEDPIGLAGGLNVFGFANGDPVSYSDPFGLCAIKGAAASAAMCRGIAAATGSEYGAGSLALDVAGGALCVGVLARGAQMLRLGGRAANVASRSGQVFSSYRDAQRVTHRVEQAAPLKRITSSKHDICATGV
jgi:RHS repeat-associated protein